MSNNTKNWKPDDDEALKDLIRATIKSAGIVDPAALPSRVREQIRARISGDVDIDAYVKKVMKESPRN